MPQRLKGHDGAILCLALSLEGCFLISGSRDGTAKVWDCVSGQCLKTFAAHTGPVTFVATMFRPPQMLDGSHLKCTTPLAFLARRIEMSTPDVPGFAGPNRRFPILTQVPYAHTRANTHADVCKLMWVLPITIAVNHHH